MHQCSPITWDVDCLNMYWALIISIAVGYLLGSMPTAWVAARYLGGKTADIRGLGDGNMGATNIGRLFGWRWGAAVGCADVLKGLIVVGFSGLLADWFSPWEVEQRLSALVIAGSTSAMAGHIWTIWLKFRGGRGAATAVGIIGAIIPVPMLILSLPTALIIARRGRTSFAFGFIVLWSNVIAKAFFDASWTVVIFSGALFALVVLTDPRLKLIKKPITGNSPMNQ